MFQRYSIVAQNESTHSSLSLKASVLAILLCSLFGANAVAIKFTLTGMGTFTAAAVRFSIAVVAIFLWTRFTHQSIRFSKGQAHQLLIISVLFVAQISLYYVGLSKTFASRAALIVNLVPFLVLLLSHFFTRDDRITPGKLIGILMGFLGILFLFVQKSDLSSDLKTGDMIIFCATLLWASGGVYTKKIIQNYHPFQMVFYPLLLAVPFLYICAFIFDKPMMNAPGGGVVAAILYQGLITGSFGFVVWNMLLQRYGAVSLHTFIFIMPVVGVLLGGLLLKEPITGNILIALALIGTGIFVTQFNKKGGYTSGPGGK
ncbi:MAG: DMT family transporter [Deltaproteobacteria bacterium]|nr:DMT family transporter [Deltaproteobacteria bacterium]NNK84165.1 DMT family transporter [Desulfobacterales bacterium]